MAAILYDLNVLKRVDGMNVGFGRTVSINVISSASNVDDKVMVMTTVTVMYDNSIGANINLANSTTTYSLSAEPHLFFSSAADKVSADYPTPSRPSSVNF